VTTAAIEPAVTDPEISTGELSRRIGEPGLCVVDVRPLFHYNGWSEPGAARGGHIPGAVALPSAWLSRLDESELQELLVDKGITESAELVIYGGADNASLFRDRVATSIDVPLRTYAAWAE
jgi:3-mercaptopyruvate sulfurtransferase SseA